MSRREEDEPATVTKNFLLSHSAGQGNAAIMAAGFPIR